MFIVELNDQMSEHSEHFPLSWSFHVVSRAQHSILLQSWTRRHVFHLHMVKHLQIWKKSKDCCGLPSGNLTYIELLIYSWFTKKNVIFHDFPCDFPWFSKCDFPWGYMSEKDCCTCCRAIWCLASDCDTGLSSGLFFYHLGYCLPTIYMALWGREFIMFIIIYPPQK